jgi:tetratricopeptide (TPR) repeat protein
MDRITRILEMLKQEEHDSFLQHALALEYIKIGNDDEAKKLFNNILSREPTYIGSYYHLGKLLERMNNLKEAIHVYQKGMEIAKAANDSHAYNELQVAYEDAKDESE